MLIDSAGVIAHPRIRRTIKHGIERQTMPKVHGIVVHQTDSSTASSTLAQYAQPRSNGAHFLIDKDGTIYQTASIYRQTCHVGKLKSRCLATRMCSPQEFKSLAKLKIPALSRAEEAKAWPLRYPSNEDAIGIELVGRFLPDRQVYETVTSKQNEALQWLISELSIELGVPMAEVFRHPDLSYKEPTEAKSASWGVQ